MWNHAAPLMTSTIHVVATNNEERRYIKLVFNDHDGYWNGITTYLELMNYDYDEMPLTCEQREEAWTCGTIVK